MLLLYRKQGEPLGSFTYFNINALEQSEYLENILADYILIVKQPTHLLDSLLDHLYN